MTTSFSKYNLVPPFIEGTCDYWGHWGLLEGLRPTNAIQNTEVELQTLALLFKAR